MFAELEWPVYAAALAGAFCLGVSKTGFPGLAILNVLIVAELFGARESVGIILPMLILCDLIVYPLFRKYASWSRVWPLMAPALVGILIGWYLLGRIDNAVAENVIGGTILLMLILQWLRAHRDTFLTKLPDSRAFRWGSGLVIGVSTMMANAAGPAYSIYALVHRMKKEDFLGIGARFFLLLNLIKVPFLGNLELINPHSLKIDLWLLPGLLLGILSGRKLIALVPQKWFEWLLYAFSLIAAVRMILF